MCGPLLLLGIMLPILELSLLIHLGGRIGFFETLFLVVFTAVVGFQFARGQSFAVLNRLHGEGIATEAHLLHGPLLILAALFLLFPGFITDGLGALLLLPPMRALVARWLIHRFKPQHGSPRQQPTSSGPAPDDDIIVIRPSKTRRDC